MKNLKLIMTMLMCVLFFNINAQNLKNNIDTNTTFSEESESTQCKGVLKNGNNCEHKTFSFSGYCKVHETQYNSESEYTNKTENISYPKNGPSSQRCSGTTKSGSRCKRMTTNPNGRCHQH